jgi:NADPH:quinone reductase-like Zn-dependent oxidoreductase
MKVLKITSANTLSLFPCSPVPRLRPGYILIKIHAVALNPCDAKNLFSTPYSSSLVDTTLGTDYAGIIVSLGDTTSYLKKWKIGERVCGWCMGGNVDQVDEGAFGDFAAVKADLAIRLPQHMGFVEAAGLGVAVCTAGMGWRMMMMGRMEVRVSKRMRGMGGGVREWYLFMVGVRLRGLWRCSW